MDYERVYIAAPGFTTLETDVLRRLESILRSAGIDHFSPFRDQPQLDNQKTNTKEIFDRNVEELDNSTMLFVCIDDFDPGTIWEFGYAYAKKARIICFSTQDHGLNLMLAEAADGFFKTLKGLQEWVDRGMDDGTLEKWKGEKL